MNDVAALCERVVVINHGVTVFDGDLTALRGRADAGVEADLDQVMSKLFTAGS